MKKQEIKNQESIIELKKHLFEQTVIRSAKSLNAEPPKVIFWDNYCPYDSGLEIAHIHLDSNIICIPLRNLKNMKYEDIEETATHEVAHLVEASHDPEFYKVHDNIKITTWVPKSSGMIIISENKDGEDIKVNKNPIKNKCNYHICNKRTKTIGCKYCKSYYCKEHLKPREAHVSNTLSSRYDNLNETNSHPCLVYTNYFISKKEREGKIYGKKLAEVLKPNSSEYSEPQIESYNHNNIEKNYEEEQETKKEIKKISIIQKIKCFLSFHNWQKYMGFSNIGGGKFSQKYICIYCKKIKTIIK